MRVKRKIGMTCFIVLLIGSCTAIDSLATIYSCVSPDGSKTLQNYPCAEGSTSESATKTDEDSARTLLGGIRLSPGNDIPDDAFKAFYFNVNQPSKPIATEIVREVSVNYHSNQFHNIPSKSFMGYWVGRFNFQQVTKLRLNLSQSNASSRVLIDGRTVYEGGGDPNRTVEFAKGSHRIEIEHLNKWHTTDFLMTLAEEHKEYPYEEVRTKFQEIITEKTKVVYGGVYESNRNDHSITLDLKETGSPVLLLLNSYEPVKWILQGAGKENLRAVLLSSVKTGSEVRGDYPPDMLIFYYHLSQTAYTLLPKCGCTRSYFHCEGSNFLTMVEEVKRLTHKNIDGFSGKYSTGLLAVPELVLDRKQYDYLENKAVELEEQRAECTSDSPRDLPGLVTENEEVDLAKLRQLPQVQTALNCMKYIQNNEFDNFLKVLHPKLLRSAEDKLHESFVQMHNQLAGVTIRIDYILLGSKEKGFSFRVGCTI